MKTWLALCWWTWWCAVLPAQDPVGPAEVGASSAAKATGAPVEVVTAEAKVAAILAAHHAGRFDVAMAVAALADPEPGVATTAAAIVRHTWVVLPPELFAALSREPTAARVLLRELALAPRPAAAGFAAAQAEAQPSRSLAHRLWALAARGTPLTRSEGELVLQALRGGAEREPEETAEVHEAAAATMCVLPPATADALLGSMHQVLLQPDAFVGVLLPLLDRLSPAGVARLLGLVVTLPEPNAMVLCRRVHEGAPTILSERVAAALDGELPLEPIWLPFAGALLDRDARIERLVALAAAPTTDARVADLAFAALLDAGIATPAVQQLAVTAVGEVGRRRVRDLLAVGADQVPADWLLRRLNEEPARAKLAVQALLRRATFEPELEAWLVELLSQAGPAEGPFLRIAAEVVVQRGSPAVVQQVWPQLARSPHAAGFAASLGRRQQPFTRELLRSELGTQRVGRPELRAAAALALVAQGDDLGSQWLLGHADKLPLPMLQRGATAIVPPAAAALQLLHWAGIGVTPTAARTTPSQAVLAPLPKVSVDAAERAAALVSWAGRCTSEPAVMEALWRLWRDADTDADVRDAALQALAASPARDQLVAEWQQALATSAPAAVAGALPFELLGSMATPASATDLELAASMVLLWPAPATVAVAEVREFDPLVLAVAERLRGEPPAAVAAAFVATATRGLGPTAAAPTRCVELLFALPTVPFRQSVAGALAGWAGAVPPCATATSLPTSPPTWLEPWPAAWFALVAAQQRGDAAAAARCAAMARDALLLTPSQQFLARPLLGERDPAAGVDPLAALAAAPHVAAWQLAIAAGDAAAQQRAANLVREFAGHDAATVAMLATVPPRSEETSR